MGWEKSDHEGRVCYENNGQRVFSTQEVDMLQNQTFDRGIPVRTTTNSEAVFCAGMFFVIGLIAGILIGLSL